MDNVHWDKKRKEALAVIYMFGNIAGAHHKQWLLDQLVRILADDYEEWVDLVENGEDGRETYEWDTGIAP